MGPVPGDCDSVTLPVSLSLNGPQPSWGMVSPADSASAALQAEGIKACISFWKL